MSETLAAPPKEQALTTVPLRMSFEEFLQWADEDTRAEWVQGEVILMSPAASKHQLMVRFLSSILAEFVDAHNLGVVLPSPFVMRAAPHLPAREPDLLYLASAHASRNRDSYLEGPADLVVEVVSPDSRARDRGAKYYEYEEGGVREYWLIDPARRQAEFYVLAGAGHYELVPVDEQGRYHSTAIAGLWIDRDWLWQNPHPRTTAVAREWGLP